MTCGSYNCARATNPYYQVRYMANTYSAGVLGANVPYGVSSHTTYNALPGSLGVAGSYSS